MNSSAELFTELCTCRWYTVSVRTQKLLLFFIHHSTKTYTFLIGGLFVPGFEGFGRLLKMSFSYFTVMYSAPV
ncbi:uncharacterized protein LOC143212649 [Lasioglossum baleicum]|uniref:uncharacterized protein LOC143212649 n=1 Tax=Lasioglossum baleicum TaxID=434251 RepID=UPI003FCE3A67